MSINKEIREYLQENLKIQTESWGDGDGGKIITLKLVLAEEIISQTDISVPYPQY